MVWFGWRKILIGQFLCVTTWRKETGLPRLEKKERKITYKRVQSVLMVCLF